jgi:Chaperone of endosialidase
MNNRNIILSLFAFGCFALCPVVQAVVPSPDGGYPGGNTAEGQAALFNLTTGGFNTAVGWLSLRSNMEGNFNTAAGAGTLLLNTANENTATGAGALLSNTTGSQNIANGAFALFSNTTGAANTATGDSALANNTTGDANTAYGYRSLFNTTGSDNTAIGVAALSSNTTGSGNIALGISAGFNHTNGSNNIDIGNTGLDGESGIIRIGTVGNQIATFIAGINGVPVAGTGVVVASDGQLGVAASSQRFKDEIKSMDDASEAVLALKPVTFRYKHEIDPNRIPQFGLIAEQVERVNPDLVVRDAKGEPYTVRYDAVNAMLLNEFLKEHRKVQELEKQVERLTAGLQKVSEQLEVSAVPISVVLNKP